ncbi:MAG: hypothetical protein JWR50_2835 [Mucilaginibacter sp.]|nr:hypothetical protein [Mucilaginibacter sp.]
MKKYTLPAILLFLFIGAHAQLKVTQGTNSPEFKSAKQPKLSSFANDNGNYFIAVRTEHFEKINTLIIADKGGNISTATDIKINRGSF